jgi:glycerol kinase
MAGLAIGHWATVEDCLAGQDVERVFTPQMDDDTRKLYSEWTEAVHRCMGWAKR